MEAEELRLGNIIQTHDGKVIIVTLQVLSDIANGLKLMTNPPVCPYKPIPVTREWPEKFGFEKTNIISNGIMHQYSLDNFPDGHFHLWVGKEPAHVELHPIGGLEEEGLIIETEYIHQIQNLYYSLVFKDLVYVKEN